jgi:hypothetical protein
MHLPSRLPKLDDWQMVPIGELTFGENAALLVIAAALAASLTGVLAPLIAQRVTRRRILEQKRFEEDLDARRPSSQLKRNS